MDDEEEEVAKTNGIKSKTAVRRGNGDFRILMISFLVMCV